ncbi:MAG: plasmid pRiA4b ORF-3 family protein [Rickettsiales bacterium]|jgi:hypothetical protein|nr:plasmid pRiA4b ORF-3 family protein [Rickettsiales bacterium]
MPPKKKESTKASSKAPLYLFKIELKYITPKIWRKFFVPSDMKLIDFHNVIVNVMGWIGYHLHEFEIFGETYSNPRFDDIPVKSETEYKLNSFCFEPKSKFKYTYDFGDSWVHQLTVMDIDYQPKEVRRRVGCIAGARNCPPEDIGGVSGYKNFLEAILDPDHEDYELFEDDLEFDAGYFDIDSINRRL